MVSNDFPPPPLACGAGGRGDEVSAWAGLVLTGVGLGSGLMTGNRLEMFPAGAVEVKTGPVGAPVITGSTGWTSAWDDVAAIGVGAGEGSAGAVVGLGVLLAAAATVVVPVACTVTGGFVAAWAEEVRETDVAPLDGAWIWAWRVNDDGVTSVPSGPSWQEAVPSPLGHRPVNTAWPADAVSVTDTSGAAPFSAWTWTVNPAALPARTLDWDGRTMTHSSTDEPVGDAEGDGAADDVTVAGNGRHCEPALEAFAARA